MTQANDANADDRTRAALLRLLDFEAGDHETSHEIYADDAVLEFPQSGERFVGKRNFLEWRQQYPAAVQGKVRRILGGGDLWIVEGSVSYDGGEWQYGVSIHEFRDNLVIHETIYGTPGWEAPTWRAPAGELMTD